MTQKEMNDLNNELDTQLKFADALMEELKHMQPHEFDLSPEETKRVKEIEDLLAEKKIWITKANELKRKFYAPPYPVAC